MRDDQAADEHQPVLTLAALDDSSGHASAHYTAKAMPLTVTATAQQQHLQLLVELLQATIQEKDKVAFQQAAALQRQWQALTVDAMHLYLATCLRAGNLAKTLAYVTTFFRLQALAFDVGRVQRDLALEVKEAPEIPVRHVDTGHPCEPTPLASQLQASIVAETVQRLAGKVDNKELLQQQLGHLPASFFKNKQPSVPDEVARVDRLANHVDLAAQELEMQLSPTAIIAQPVSESYVWVGTESDRNTVTAEVMLQTRYQFVLEQVERYSQHLLHLQQMVGEQQPLAGDIIRLQQAMAAKIASLQQIPDKLKTLAAIRYQQFGAEAEFNQHNLKEIFQGDIAKLRASCAKLDAATSGSQALQLETEIFYLFASSTADTDEIKQKIEELIAQTADKSIRQYLIALGNEFMRNGLHGRHGQGRLDVQTMMRPLAKAFLEKMQQQGKGIDPNLDLNDKHGVLQAIESYFEKHGSQELQQYAQQIELTPELQERLRYLQYIQRLNVANPGHVTHMVLANFEDQRDFAEAFFACAAVGLIQIEQGQVKESLINLMPLFETADDHFNARKTVTDILGMDIFTQYIQKVGFYFMSAYSDTPRSSSLPYAKLAIRVGIHQAYHVVKDFFARRGQEVRVAFQRGIGSSDSRFGGATIDTERQGWTTSTEADSFTTYQPGMHDYDNGHPLLALAYLKRELYDRQPTHYTQQLEAELANEALIDELKQILQSGQSAYQQQTQSVTSQWTQLLIRLPQTQFMLNTQYGSRGRPYFEVRAMKGSVFASQRAIKVAQVSNALGWHAMTVIPLYAILQANDVARLQQLANESVLFRQEILYKAEELLYYSQDNNVFEAALAEMSAQDRQQFAPFVAELAQITDAVQRMLNEVLKQTELLQRRTEERAARADDTLPLVRQRKATQQAQQLISLGLFKLERELNAKQELTAVVANELDEAKHIVFQMDALRGRYA
jgi:hypothetical protein